MSHPFNAHEAPPTLPSIAGYRVQRVIGDGGMATVYLGTQLSLGRDVAIKVMRPEALADEVSRRRFENEARTIARLEHPHIVGIHEVGRTADGLPWYSMPYLARGHLGRRDFTGEHERVRETLRALLSALAYAHARGIIHRDVKAENVLFDETDRPLLADFGIALRRGHGTRVTMVGLAVGSTAYMAPEQARGQQVDFRADLYSVGVLAWEMLNGRLPYQAEDALSMALAHAQDPVPRLPAGLRHWQRFIDRALAKSPERRFNTAAQMLQALDDVPEREGMHGFAPLAGIGRGVRALRRAPLPLWLTAAFALALCAGWWSQHADRARAATMEIASSNTARQRQALPPPPSAVDKAAPSHTSATPPPGEAPAALADIPQTSGGRSDAPAPLPAMPVPGAQVAPISEADRHLTAATALFALPRSADRIGEGFEFLTRAWQSDREHLGLAAASRRAFAATGDHTSDLIGRGRIAEARRLLRTARQFAALTGQADAMPMQELRTRTEQAIQARIAVANERLDRRMALASLDAATDAGLGRERVGRLRQQAMAIPDLPGLLAAIPGRARLVRGPHTVFAISDTPVSRADYAAFVAATGHSSASCRARGSLLRAFAPRNWARPGFEQAPTDPVVCVSWHDAIDYARWRSEIEGRSIVVASTAQGESVPPAAEAPAEWRSDCERVCKHRVVSGQRRHDSLASRNLDPRRGYDDVGFRLAYLP